MKHFLTLPLASSLAKAAGMKATLWFMLGLASLAGLRATGEEPAFDRVVAPVLAGRCLDCHSGPKPKGKLDLSRKEQALKQIVAGAPGRSRLWAVVEADEMPPKHPLPENEKAILRDWIEGPGRIRLVVASAAEGAFSARDAGR